jgi:hypothetical protein
MNMASLRRALKLAALLSAFTFALGALGLSSASAAPYGDTSGTVGVINPGPCSGNGVTIVGSGYQPGQAVSVGVSGGSTQSVSAGGDGGFSVSLPLNTLPLGSYAVTATAGGRTASSGFAISACDATTATASPSVANSATSAGTNSDSLASTGAAVGGIALLAAGLLVGGIVLIASGRRRRV